jgi:phospholipid/cholesterol/gamma-HCH transport system permease protein
MTQTAKYQISDQGNTRRLELSGAWVLQGGLPTGAMLWQAVMPREKEQAGAELAIAAKDLTAWDTGLLMVLRELLACAEEKGWRCRIEELPDGARRLLELARAVPERPGTRKSTKVPGWLTRLGLRTQAVLTDGHELLVFIGEVTLALGRLLRGKARYRRQDLVLMVQATGAEALPIVALISGLVGLILAFVGAVQLSLFGAQIYVADLVGIGMAREMAAMMTGIIMAGRTGAAFAAQLGTMQVNEEVDALTTFGLRPLDFLVLPRMLALMVMMPLLYLYANLLGIGGGAFVGVAMLKLSPLEYLNETVAAVGLTDFAIGMVKSVVFGAVVSVAGCWRGMQCGRSAQAVGVAATSAVVTGLIWIVVTDALITLICNALGI